MGSHESKSEESARKSALSRRHFITRGSVAVAVADASGDALPEPLDEPQPATNTAAQRIGSQRGSKGSPRQPLYTVHPAAACASFLRILGSCEGSAYMGGQPRPVASGRSS